MTNLLERLNSPEDLKLLSLGELKQLAADGIARRIRGVIGVDTPVSWTPREWRTRGQGLVSPLVGGRSA